MHTLTHKKGTTLLELVIAIGIIITGILTLVGLIVRSIQLGTRTKNELIALMLAQEGVESVRSLRDANFLEMQSGIQPSAWNMYLHGTSTNRFDYTFIPWFDFTTAANSALPVWTPLWTVNAFTDANAIVKFNQTTGMFFQDTDVAPLNNTTRKPTPFRRLIAVVPICDDGLNDKADGNPNHADISNVNDPASIASYFNDLKDWDGCTIANPEIGVHVVSRVEWSGDKKTEDVILTQDLYNWKQ